MIAYLRAGGADAVSFVAVEDAVSIKVGDRVKLLGWEGEENGMDCNPGMRRDVGKVGHVRNIELDHRSHGRMDVLVLGWWWPLSKVEKVP